ncbi:hypothetical protein C7H84_21345 [Burkholderia sp. Nafp2/4-1b]|nr:hypothetical protein C7H84_21345 [Burkholderia sp. Nafp2/4-1b]
MGHGYPEWEPARIAARVAVKTGGGAASGAFKPMIVRATFSRASARRPPCAVHGGNMSAQPALRTRSREAARGFD